MSGAVEYETDRARFLGRGRTPANPAALDTGSRLSGTTGPVLDPVFSLRRRVRLAPGGTARVAFVTGAAETREAATALAEHFRELDAAGRAFDRAREWGREELRELGLTPDDVALINRLAGAVVFTGPALRRTPSPPTGRGSRACGRTPSPETAPLCWRLTELFDPPFDKGASQPGYSKGYVPDIRENGGQYTHAATWVVLATALQGRGDRALELWNRINPVHHATTPAEVDHYKVEPYVVCADVYGAPPHTGRGGWTWYAGSAGWLYRVALEAILGLRPAGDTLRVEPCVPAGWPGYEVTYRHRSATYRVRVENPAGAGRGVRSVTVDGQPVPDGAVPLRDDGRAHEVRVVLG